MKDNAWDVMRVCKEFYSSIDKLFTSQSNVDKSPGLSDSWLTKKIYFQIKLTTTWFVTTRCLVSSAVSSFESFAISSSSRSNLQFNGIVVPYWSLQESIGQAVNHLMWIWVMALEFLFEFRGDPARGSKWPPFNYLLSESTSDLGILNFTSSPRLGSVFQIETYHASYRSSFFSHRDGYSTIFSKEARWVAEKLTTWKHQRYVIVIVFGHHTVWYSHDRHVIHYRYCCV